jgi:hypothetical protein
MQVNLDIYINNNKKKKTNIAYEIENFIFTFQKMLLKINYFFNVFISFYILVLKIIFLKKKLINFLKNIF